MASRSLNKVTLIGNLTRDPEVRYTPSGTAVCTFGLATNRSWTTDSGEKKEETEFHRLVAWAKLAEICGKFLIKGKKIYIEGRLQTRSWTGQDGQMRQSTEIVIEDMIMLNGARRTEETVSSPDSVAAVQTAQPQAQASTPTATTLDDSTTTPSPKKKKKTEEEKVSPDDIPF